MTASGFISLGCLLITGALATWGIFSRHFDDSLVQRVGLSLLAIACVLRIPDKIAYPHTPPELLLAQIGLCIFGVGTAIKLYRKNRSLGERLRRGASAGV